jgi:hypothetical protein
VRYCTRLGFKMEPRTAEWFQLALARGLHRAIPPADVGREVRQLTREENPSAILKAWEAHGLIGAIHPQLPRRHPDYEGLARIARVTEAMTAAGVRPRLFAPVTFHLLARLRPLERAATLRRLAFSRNEIDAVWSLEEEAKKAVKILRGRRTALPRDAYFYLDKLSGDLLAFMQARYPHPKAMNKIRNYLRKWRPLRLQLPVAELDSLGVARGPQFDKILEDLFEAQLRGRASAPQDRTRLLRRLAGIKPPKKLTKKELEKEKKRAKQAKKAAEPAAAPAPPAAQPPAPPAAKAKKRAPTPAPRSFSAGGPAPTHKFSRATTSGRRASAAARPAPASGGRRRAAKASKRSAKPRRSKPARARRRRR